MKKIFLLGACLITSVVFAQGLFPELEGFGPDAGVAAPKSKKELKKNETEEVPQIAPEAVEKVEEEEQPSGEEAAQKEETDLFAENKEPESVVTAESQDKSADGAEEEETEEEKRSAQIRIYSDNVDATITPNRNFSYCFGSIKFYNGLRRVIQNLEVKLTYGDIEANYTIRNLAPKATQEESITLLGTACEVIMEMPAVEVKKCQVPEMEENACKKRVVFVPLR